MRLRKLTAVASAAAACLLVTAAASAATAPAATTGPPVALTGNIAGNPTSIDSGMTATFVITETSTWPTMIQWSIQPFVLTGVQIQSGLCVFGHYGTTGDGWTCEPFLRTGQATTLVLTTKVTGAPGTTAKVKFCAYNSGGPGGNAEPCKTLSVKVNG
jgi:hypothetical protein